MKLIRLGATGDDVTDIQRRLAALGFRSAVPGVFDASTKAAVRAFQQQRGLTTDGIVGDETWDALVAASFRLGDRMLYLTREVHSGDDVRELQRRLNRLGFECGHDDGTYGELTAEAVREFQLNAGLDVDGIAGPETVDVLLRLHRAHQASSAAVIGERAALRRPHRTSVTGAMIFLDPFGDTDRPGHAFADSTREHELTWQICALLDGRLTARGAHVRLSRGPHNTMSSEARAAYANAEQTDAVLSVQMNAAPSAAAKGASARFFGTDAQISERGQQLANLCLDAVVAATGTPHCRAHPSTTTMLRATRAPAAVIELGYLSHPEEGQKLTEPAYQRLLADALVAGLIAFLTRSALIEA
ncbi:MAG: peptidoglycan-binding protein [Nitriliruptoraceae bacterium]